MIGINNGAKLINLITYGIITDQQMGGFGSPGEQIEAARE